MTCICGGLRTLGYENTYDFKHNKLGFGCFCFHDVFSKHWGKSMDKETQIKLGGMKYWKLKHEWNAVMFIKFLTHNYMLCIRLGSKWMVTYNYFKNQFNLRSGFRRLGASFGMRSMKYISGYQGQLSDFIDSKWDAPSEICRKLLQYNSIQGMFMSTICVLKISIF